jgi:site-specific DNA recombinase
MSQRSPDSPKAVIYARVSSKEQEREGFSIPAQLDLLHGYAQHKRFEVAQEFKDVETAKVSGRREFNRMVDYIGGRNDVRVILVEETDRLYRNFRDYVTLEELDIEVHLVKEGEIISKDSRSHVKFIHGIKVLMAKNYLDNLSEEVRKGMSQKAKEGVFPGKAPIGYVNIEMDGKKVVVVDPESAQNVRWLFEQYASGRFSLRELRRTALSEGLYFGSRYTKLMGMHVQKILTNPFYYGYFRWRGEVFKDMHEPIISRGLYDQVQSILRAKSQLSDRPRRHRWAFQGMVKCGYCGCMYTTERKKGKIRLLSLHEESWRLSIGLG